MFVWFIKGFGVAGWLVDWMGNVFFGSWMGVWLDVRE